MGTGRWLRLDVGWDDSEWIILLEPLAQLAWIKLLCHAKRDGRGGRVKALTPRAAAKKWNIPVQSVGRMIGAATQDGALAEVDGKWVVSKWKKYQEPDTTVKKRMREYRSRLEAEEMLRRNGA